MAATNEFTSSSSRNSASSRGTELFLSDPHGEYEAFAQVVRGSCGGIRKRVDTVAGGRLSEAERAGLTALICYPREKTACEAAQAADPSAWRVNAIGWLSAVLRDIAGEHSCSQVKAAFPAEGSEHAQELAAFDPTDPATAAATARVAEAAVADGTADALIRQLAQAIRTLSVARVHVLGDIYDRGPAPHMIMEEMMACPSIDLVWGNHDIVWMGAALGQPGCIAHVVRNCARYGNLSVLSESYGIDISPLLQFAQTVYSQDPCIGFALKGGLEGNPQLSVEEYELNVKVQKAMAILQFKVEAQLIDENPSFGLKDRKLLGAIDFVAHTVVVDGTEYPITDHVFPTVDPADPYRLTAEEADVMERLERAFRSCEKLQRHIAFLLDAGSLYRIDGCNLMFHACVPLNVDGTLMEVGLYGETLKGRALFDAVDRWVREAFSGADEIACKRGADLLWYLWLGPGSPLFAKSKMATFEIYYIADKAARKEVKNPFYALLEDARALEGIFQDFGMDPTTSRILCGHVPVKVKDGEDPVKCSGKAIILDGGMSRAYQKTTGIAGFALVSDSDGDTLCTLQPFAGTEAAVANGIDIEFEARAV